MPGKTLVCDAYTRPLSFFKTFILLSTILLFPAFASAQTEEEIKMLRMYRANKYTGRQMSTSNMH